MDNDPVTLKRPICDRVILKWHRVPVVAAIAVALACLVLVPEVTPQNDTFKGPLRKCWERPKMENDLKILASDNGQLYLLTSSTQTLTKLSLISGQPEWAADSGGEFLKLVITPNGDPIYAANVQGKGSYIRRLSRVSGLTVTQWDFPLGLAPDSMQLISADSAIGGRDAEAAGGADLVFLDAEHRVRTIDLASGLVTLGTRLSSTTPRLVLGGGVLSAFEGRWLYEDFEQIDPKSFGGDVADITALVGLSGERFAFADRAGQLGVHRIGKPAPVWVMKTGGAISQITTVGSALIAVSRDNYIYSVDRNYGSLKWKIRFQGRIAPVSFGQRFAAVSTVDSQQIDIIDLNTGKRVNRIDIAGYALPVAGFQLAGDRVVADLGQVLAAFSSSCNPTK